MIRFTATSSKTVEMERIDIPADAKVEYGIPLVHVSARGKAMTTKEIGAFARKSIGIDLEGDQEIMANAIIRTEHLAGK